MAARTPQRVHDDLDRLAHRGLGVREFSLQAARVLRRAVPFDGVCVLTMDPATFLPTGEVVENGLPPAVYAQMAQIEYQGSDFNSWDGLMRSGRRAASLSGSTEGDLARSERHRDLRRPHGFGDELRMIAADQSAAWAGLTLLRAADGEDFTPSDGTLMASVSGHLAEGIRRAMMFGALPADDDELEDASGVILLGPDDALTQADAAGERWLAELGGGPALPPAVTAVAGQARAITRGSAPAGAVARARVPTPAGAWLVVRGSILDGPDGTAAVMVERARPHELSPLIADAYGLSERERAITALVARGLQTDAIAERLYISPWTVQDHLKSIFEKLDVSTRGEMVARVFFEHYAPRLV